MASTPRLFRALADRMWAFTRPRGCEWVYANGGLGDELMLTAIARAARRAGRPLHVLTNLPVIWKGNSDVAAVQSDIDRWHYAFRRGWITGRIRHLEYQTTRRDRHIGQQMADHVEITLPENWRPTFSTPPGRISSRRITVQNSCRGARFACTTKEWAIERWQQVVDALAEFEILQLGTRSDPPLEGVRDLRGKTSLIEAATLIARSRCFIGLESGLMHVAAAVHTPAVIVYGGRTTPTQTGYAFNRNITRHPPCVGCGLDNDCPNQMVCMNISASEVAQAVRQTVEATSSVTPPP